MANDSRSRIDPELPRGVKLLHDPVHNKGTAFTAEERDALSLRGLLPARECSQDLQALRVMENLQRKPNDLERYIQLVALQDRNETLFYRVLVDNLEALLPLVYTPTVGRACQLYGHIYRRPRGLYITAADRGHIAETLRNWPHEDVRVIVVTDGERILGLGDLGAAGMGIPIGKLSLYTACAGIDPTHCLPITLDVGTDNEALLSDALYLGAAKRRLRGEAYDELVDEFVDAVQAVFPRAVIQLEDFATANAFRLLARYRDRACVFDDDIQGTAAVVLAGLYAALRIRGGALGDGRFLMVGAGEAGVGIGELIVRALREEGMDEDEARRRCWFVDSEGLVVAGRERLAPHKRPFAHSHAPMSDLAAIVEEIRPTALIGACGVHGTFTRPVLESMAAINERPIVFALSNPTSKAECTAQEAYGATGGRAIFASGSPFAAVTFGDREYVPGQANNAYIFPGVGLGLIATGASRASDEMFFAAARALAAEVAEADLERGRVFPPLRHIRDVSVRIALAVAEVAYDAGLATRPRPEDLEAFIRAGMFEPTYPRYA